jgi:hypothetical protein
MKSFSLLQVSIFLATLSASGVNGLAAPNVPRRAFLASSMAAVLLPEAAANARYVMNEETGDYDEVDDPTWQEAWKGRLDKAQSMSSDEVFMAARGAGNLDLKDGEESAPSKKRRAMAACRDATLLEKAGVRDPKECTTRIMGGEVDFMLKVISSE